jgi:hypothetical protein
MEDFGATNIILCIILFMLILIYQRLYNISLGRSTLLIENRNRDESQRRDLKNLLEKIEYNTQKRN